MMPGLDGSEVAARIRTDPDLRDVPVLFMTALVSHREARGGSCSSGGQTFLPKTLGTGKLIECIEEKLAAVARDRAEPVTIPAMESPSYAALVAMAG
jgi:CheY-like chemotaxis protein